MSKETNKHQYHLKYNKVLINKDFIRWPLDYYLATLTLVARTYLTGARF